MQVAAMVFYMLCETFNKNQFVLNFVVCIVLLAMDFWTVRAMYAKSAACLSYADALTTSQAAERQL